MIIGNENLKDLFPEFEDCIKENGLDTMNQNDVMK